MKFLIPLPFILFALIQHCFSQTLAQDKAVRYQQERMVYLQWDKNKFEPKAGFLSLNPYYWLTWGCFTRVTTKMISAIECKRSADTTPGPGWGNEQHR
jgi:hypothetical protein